MFVSFYNRAVQTKIDESGLPFYTNQVFVIIARDMTNQVDRKATQEDFDRFPEHYDAFKKATARDENREGLLIEMWPLATPADVENLKAHGYYTVQELARVSREKQREMPAHISALADSARTYAKVAGDTIKSATLIEQLSQEVKDLREENGLLRAQIKTEEKEVA